MKAGADPLAPLIAFARHLRDPLGPPPPAGMAAERLALYRELFLRNIESLLAANFPVCRRLLGEAGFRALVEAFFAQHRSRTPYFPRLGEEFLLYLGQRSETPLWLRELAHYEWVELALAIDPTELSSVKAVAGDPLSGAPVANPVSCILCYRWPVHRLRSVPEQEEPPGPPTYLLVLRGRDDRVRFHEVAPWTAALLQRIREHPGASGHDHLLALAEAFRQPTAAFLAMGRPALESLVSCEALLGVAPAEGGSSPELSANC